MRRSKRFSVVLLKTAVLIFVVLCSSNLMAADLYLDGGISVEINYTVVGSVVIEDANVAMYEPAYIQGFVITGSGAVLDVYGGQIEYMLLISTSDLSLPEGQVTVYGTDFTVDGVPLDPNTTELFLQSNVLSGVYEDGTPFSIVVDCAITAGSDFAYYQTVKLGWLSGEPDIELSQNDYDFGQTDIGTTQTGIVTVYNLGNEVLNLQSLEVVEDQDVQFEFTPLEVMPLTLAPDMAIDIEIFYTPVVEGLAQATLLISCDDPNDPVVEVALSGEGIPVVLSSEEQIAQIFDTYDWAVENDLIEGVGKNKSAKNKLRVFGKMLTVAENLIAGGYYDYALDVLLMIEKKCDGQKRPKDFIKGPVAVDLNIRINELIDTLQDQ